MKGILITSVGNIGTGNQILHSLRLTDDKLMIVGTDITSTVDTHMLDRFYKIDRPSGMTYFQQIDAIISENDIGLIFVGSMSESVWFLDHNTYFKSRGIKVVLGTKRLFELCMDKSNLFSFLMSKGIPVPKFIKINSVNDCERIDFFPVVLKQNRYAVASNHVYLAFDKEDLFFLSSYLLKNGVDTIAQEWIGNHTNEFSVSVTSLDSGNVLGVASLRRSFESAISYKNKVFHNNQTYYISSGISQGKVEIIPKLNEQVSMIAKALESTGPLNLQGKWENDIFYLIDAHPAITSSVYLKALAGYNEPLYYVNKYLRNDNDQNLLEVREAEIIKKTISIIKEAGTNLK